MIELLSILNYSCMFAFLSYVIVDSYLLEDLRERIIAKDNCFSYMVQCKICTIFHSMWVYSLVWKVVPYFFVVLILSIVIALSVFDDEEPEDTNAEKIGY